MIGDAIFIQPGDKMLGRIACQRRSAKVRIGGNKIIWLGIQVGEVAPPSSRDTDFFGQLCRVVYQVNRATAPRRMDSAHHSGCAGTNNYNVDAVVQ